MDSERSKVLFLTEGRVVPASRFRIEQLLHTLDVTGITYKVRAPTPSKYLWLPTALKRASRWIQSVVLAPQFIAVALQRLWHIGRWGRWADVIVLQRELLYRFDSPVLEIALDAWRRAGSRLVFDVDDAVHLGRDGRPEPNRIRKLEAICSRCDLVIVGNDYLASVYAAYAPIAVIPTLIDTATFVQHRARSTVDTIGWTGSASNLCYLAPLEDALNNLYTRRPFRFVIIADPGAQHPFSNPRFEVVMRGWRKESEVEQLSEIDVGLMPLTDDEWSRGKCGFKLLQYMALGIPGVASPVGVNCQIIVHGENGFLATTSQEWEESLELLLSDPTTVRQFGERARQHVEAHYSVERWSEEWRKAVLGS